MTSPNPIYDFKESDNIFLRLRRMIAKHQNTAWNIAGGIFPAISAVIAIPVLIKLLGYELFAITSLLITLAIFFHVYDFGIGRAMSFYFPKNIKNCAIESRELLNSGLLIASAFALIFSCGFYLASPYIANHWLRLPTALAPSVSSALQIAAFGIIPSVISNALKGVLEGRSAFNHANLGKILSGSLVFIAPLLAIALGKTSLESISFSIMLSRCLVLLFFSYHVHSAIGIGIGRVNLNRAKMVFNYTAWAAFSGFLSTMFVYGDRFIVARYLSPENLSIYTVSQDILIRTLLIPWAMAMALMPIFAAENLSKEKTLEQYQIYKKQINQTSMLLVLLILVFFYPCFYLWLGHDFIYKAWPIILLQTAGILFCAMCQLPLVYIYAKGAPHIVAFIFGVEALLYLAVGPWTFEKYGIIGAATIWALRLAVEFFALSFFARKLMK